MNLVMAIADSRKIPEKFHKNSPSLKIPLAKNSCKRIFKKGNICYAKWSIPLQGPPIESHAVGRRTAGIAKENLILPFPNFV